MNIEAFQRKLLKVKSKAREPESVSRNPEIPPESSNKDLSSESKIIDLTPQLVSVALTAESNNKDLASESSIKEHISESSRKDFKAESALKKPEFNEHTNNETRDGLWTSFYARQKKIKLSFSLKNENNNLKLFNS